MTNERQVSTSETSEVGLVSIIIVNQENQDSILDRIAKETENKRIHLVLRGGAKIDERYREPIKKALLSIFSEFSSHGLVIQGAGNSNHGSELVASVLSQDIIKDKDYLYIGVSPALHIIQTQKQLYPSSTVKHYPIAPGIHCLLAVQGPTDERESAFGSEMEFSFALNQKLAKNHDQYSLVFCGGPLTAQELMQDLERGIHCLVVRGSGRIADLVINILENQETADVVVETGITLDVYDKLKSIVTQKSASISIV